MCLWLVLIRMTFKPKYYFNAGNFEMPDNFYTMQALEVYSIDRFHSRDRWPQWAGETIRNI